MKKRVSQLLELIKENRHLLVALGVTLVVAMVYYFAWAVPQTFASSTHIGFDPEKMDNNMWWASDARDYRDTGDFFFGNSDEHVLNRRPWLYPFIVGLLRVTIFQSPDFGLWALQFLFWLASIIFIFLSIIRATGKNWLGILATGIFWTHPSPIALTFHGMTEVFNILLLSIFVYFLLSPPKQDKSGSVLGAENKDYWLLFLISLLLVTKPTYQLQLVVLLIYILVKSFKKWRVLRFWGKIVLALFPLWIQLLLTWQFLGYAIVSDVAGYTFKYWMLTRVYAREEGITDLHEVAPIVEAWTQEESIAYILNHKQLTVSTYFHNLVNDGLLADSYVIIDSDNLMNVAIVTLNKWYFYLHLLMLPLMGYLLLFNYKGKWEAVWIIYLTFLIQILATGISADQGDRLIITALPLWIVSYSFVIAKIPMLKE